MRTCRFWGWTMHRPEGSTILKTIAQFAIGHEQLLDAEGKVCGELPPFASDADAMRRMYSMMVLCRLFDAKAINLQRTGRLGTYAPCTGHEATHVAVGAAMRPEDVLCPVYREYGTQIWRGVTLTEILTYWAGDERGTNFAGPREDFPWCVPIGSQTPARGRRRHGLQDAESSRAARWPTSATAAPRRAPSTKRSTSPARTACRWCSWW